MAVDLLSHLTNHIRSGSETRLGRWFLNRVRQMERRSAASRSMVASLDTRNLERGRSLNSLNTGIDSRDTRSSGVDEESVYSGPLLVKSCRIESDSRSLSVPAVLIRAQILYREYSESVSGFDLEGESHKLDRPLILF